MGFRGTRMTANIFLLLIKERNSVRLRGGIIAAPSSSVCNCTVVRWKLRLLRCRNDLVRITGNLILYSTAFRGKRTKFIFRRSKSVLFPPFYRIYCFKREGISDSLLLL